MRPARRRFFAAFVLMLRALAAITALEVSGAIHFAQDVVAAVAEEPSPDDCDDPDDCPPGCPGCHCAPPATSLPPARVDATIALAPLAPRAAVGAAAIRLPLNPDLPSVFRPPRQGRAST
jgi:hypothetical protein